VDIILSGSGYEVINMGIKVNGTDIINKAIEINADAIAMSGLLVKSVEIMKENIELIRNAGLDVKVLLGGAALTEDYVLEECDPIMPNKVYYCKDAFSGVNAMRADAPIFGSIKTKQNTPKIINIKNMPNEMSVVGEGRATSSYAYNFFPIEVRDDAIWLNGKLFAEFPRLENGDCLADLYRTKSGRSILPIQLVTLGQNAVEELETLHKSGEYAKYYERHRYFVGLTEKLAQKVQDEITPLIYADGKPVKKLKRFSFGYPLCPDLSVNKTICELLKSEEIGVSVSETFQMSPIYSTCAILGVWE
jgi:cobalamin-dependent methionine synthase I